MLPPPPDARVLGLWRSLANAPTAFAEPGVTLVSDDTARVTRPGWCGVVVIGDSAIVATPAARPPAIDRLLDSTSEPELLTDPAHVAGVIGPLESTLGPADLQYGEVASAGAPLAHGPLGFTDPMVQQALDLIPEEDRSEAGFEDDSIEAIFIATDDDRPVAVAGYRRWETTAAHLGVATTPASRNRGHGRTAAHAASAHATHQGLIIQWRSLWSNEASRRLGHSLGLVHCGRQFSFRLLGDRCGQML